jgi:hypothetical protein
MTSRSKASTAATHKNLKSQLTLPSQRILKKLLRTMAKKEYKIEL